MLGDQGRCHMYSVKLASLGPESSSLETLSLPPRIYESPSESRLLGQSITLADQSNSGRCSLL